GGNREGEEQPPTAGTTPPPLAHQQVTNRHAFRLPRAIHDYVYDTGLLHGNHALQLGSRQADAICLLECAQVLRRSIDRGGVAHRTSPRTSTLEFPRPPAALPRKGRTPSQNPACPSLLLGREAVTDPENLRCSPRLGQPVGRWASR